MNDSLLSLVTFIPALAAAILAIFLRGEEAAAQRNAKWVALVATVITFLVSLFVLAGIRKTPISSLSRNATGCWA